MYIRRFYSYCETPNCPIEERIYLLISVLDDHSLGSIERNVTPETTYDKLQQLLRTAEGYDNNKRHMWLN